MHDFFCKKGNDFKQKVIKNNPDYILNMCMEMLFFFPC